MIKLRIVSDSISILNSHLYQILYTTSQGEENIRREFFIRGFVLFGQEIGEAQNRVSLSATGADPSRYANWNLARDGSGASVGRLTYSY